MNTFTVHTHEVPLDWYVRDIAFGKQKSLSDISIIHYECFFVSCTAFTLIAYRPLEVKKTIKQQGLVGTVYRCSLYSVVQNISWNLSCKEIFSGTSAPSQDFSNLSQLLQHSDYDRIRLPTRYTDEVLFHV